MPAILLTGASRGLGLSVLTLLLRSPSLNAGRPPAVVTISRSLPAELEALAKEFPDRLVCVQGDVADKAVSVEAVGKAVERFGGLEAVILNAGVLDPLGKLADVDIVRSPSPLPLLAFPLQRSHKR
jgi:NAD(P)-dependent dehydrogenase (short-subunit alcohol dehydrogenase family)